MPSPSDPSDRVVEAYYARGMNMSLLSMFGGPGPKWSIVCGRCRCGFQARLPLVHHPLVRCPCGAANRIGVTV